MTTVIETWTMTCPGCGKDKGLMVAVAYRGEGRLTPDGIEYGNAKVEPWDQRSRCRCVACGWGGKVFQAHEAAVKTPAGRKPRS